MAEQDDVKQGSEEWFQSRIGKVTASRLADVMARTKSGWGASRATYMGQIIVERLTGQPTKIHTTADMAWGTDHEPEARDCYALRNGVEVKEVAFIDHPRIRMSGASPDGMVGDDGLIEIKCRSSINHIDTLLTDAIPWKYELQMQWQMSVTGREWCDYVSYDPRMPEHLRLYVRRLPRNEELIAQMESSVETFLADVDAKVEALRSKFEN